MEASVIQGCIGIIKGLRDPSIQRISTLGPETCKCCLHWAIGIPRECRFQAKGLRWTSHIHKNNVLEVQSAEAWGAAHTEVPLSLKMMSSFI